MSEKSNKFLALIGAGSITLVVIAIFICMAFLNKGCSVVGKVTDPDVMIHNYEWFKTQYEGYNAINKKIVTAEAEKVEFIEMAGSRDKWTFEDKNEYSRQSSIVLGLKHQRDDIVSEYNAKSKMLTRNFLKDKNLPERLTSN